MATMVIAKVWNVGGCGVYCCMWHEQARQGVSQWQCYDKICCITLAECSAKTKGQLHLVERIIGTPSWNGTSLVRTRLLSHEVV